VRLFNADHFSDSYFLDLIRIPDPDFDVSTSSQQLPMVAAVLGCGGVVLIVLLFTSTTLYTCRYAGSFILPATALPRETGPAVWRVGDTGQELASAIIHLLKDPMERRSRGHAAAQGAAKLTNGLVSTVWHVVDDTVITPALHEYVEAQRRQQQGDPQ
jgi:hypothetical protein